MWTVDAYNNNNKHQCVTLSSAPNILAHTLIFTITRFPARREFAIKAIVTMAHIIRAKRGGMHPAEQFAFGGVVARSIRWPSITSSALAATLAAQKSGQLHQCAVANLLT